MNALEKRLRLSAALVLIGLLIEALSLTWKSPLSFLMFMMGGGLAMAAGIALFFYSIVVVPRPKQGA
jgi:hypothetical protein